MTVVTPRRRSDRLEMIGEFDGSGYREPRYLVIRADGQAVHLTRLLYLVLDALDGQRSDTQVAARVTDQIGKELTVEALDYLVRVKLAPLGLLAAATNSSAADGDHDIAAGIGQDTGAGGGHDTDAGGGHHAGEPPAAPAPTAKPLLALRFHATLIPVRWVGRLGALLSWLFWPPIIALLLVALVVVDAWLFGHANLGDALISVILAPGDLLVAVAAMVTVSLFHELGHAAGCRRGGGRPGRIGIGLYVIFPAFYTDVTDSYRLSRRGRLRTDLGGVYFSAIAALLAGLGHLATGAPILLLVAFLAQVELVQQLLPLVRMDGYFILTDLVGVPDLFGRIRPMMISLLPGRRTQSAVAQLLPRTRIIVTAWVAVVVPTLSLAFGYLILQTPVIVRSTVETWWHAWDSGRAGWLAGSVPVVVLAVLTAVLASLPLLGLVVMVAILLRRSCGPLLRRLRRLLPQAERAVPAMSGGGLRWTTWASGAAERTSARGITPDAAAAIMPAVHPDPLRDNQLAPDGGADDAPGQQEREPGAPQFTEGTMLRPRRRAPGRGWRRSVFLLTGGRIVPGPTKAEQAHQVLLDRCRRPIGQARRIVVLSRKGGVGKTTTTLMLGHTFASIRGDRVVALDANPDAGNLGQRVPRETTATVTTLLADAQRIERYTDIRRYTSQAQTRLEVVASDDDPRITSALGMADYRTVIDTLDRHYTLIIIDTGTGILDDAIQGILGQADQLIVVMPPALDGARVAAGTLDWLDQHRHSALVAGAIAVVNGVRDAAGLVDLARVDEHFAHRCSAVVHIPWDRTLEAGAQVALDELASSTRTAYLELAAAVADRFDDSSARRARMSEEPR